MRGVIPQRSMSDTIARYGIQEHNDAQPWLPLRHRREGRCVEYYVGSLSEQIDGDDLRGVSGAVSTRQRQQTRQDHLMRDQGLCKRERIPKLLE